MGFVNEPVYVAVCWTVNRVDGYPNFASPYGLHGPGKMYPSNVSVREVTCNVLEKCAAHSIVECPSLIPACVATDC